MMLERKIRSHFREGSASEMLFVFVKLSQLIRIVSEAVKMLRSYLYFTTSTSAVHCHHKSASYSRHPK
jgi:hypothetical protein